MDKKLSQANNSVNSNLILAKEWHPQKNIGVNQTEITLGSGKKVWWLCPVGHEWEAQVLSRSRGSGCPYCSGRFATKENNLLVLNPKLASEWNFDRNVEKFPGQYKPGSNKIVWWVCSKGHEWQASINRRSQGTGCPGCSGRMATKENNLAIHYPDLSTEWHYTKNLNLKPENVLPKSGKTVWWRCNNGHEWESKIVNRTSGSDCPYCDKRRANDDNNLTVTHPHLLDEWHLVKNTALDPKTFTVNTGKRVWWICKHGHEWVKAINERARGIGCPYCAGKKASSTNNLRSKFPALSVDWNYKKNHDLKPEDVAPHSNKKVWWICDKGHEWEEIINNRTKGYGCPGCSGRMVTEDNNLFTVRPEIANEWNYKKNNTLRPENFTCGSGKKVWWVCNYGHDWRTSIGDRTKINGTYCPYCSNQSSRLEIRVYVELKTVFKEVVWRERIDGIECDVYLPKYRTAIEIDGYFWHKNKYKIDKAKNKILKKADISTYRIREKGLKYIELKDIQFNNADKTKVIVSRLLKSIAESKTLSSQDQVNVKEYLILEQCANESEYQKILSMLPAPPVNKSLATKYPELAREWNFYQNGDLKPTQFSPSSRMKVWWKCKNSHEWETRIDHRVNMKSGCPYCAGKRASVVNNLEIKHPSIANQWHPKKNEGLKSKDFTPGSSKKVWWKCKNGHEWKAVISSRSQGVGCPFCSGKRASTENNLKTLFQGLAKEWHPVKNGALLPDLVLPKSHKKVWWLCKKGHEYQAVVYNRTKGSGCPYCSGRLATKEINLAVKAPHLIK
jgi:hypothetical protein